MIDFAHLFLAVEYERRRRGEDSPTVCRSGFSVASIFTIWMFFAQFVLQSAQGGRLLRFARRAGRRREIHNRRHTRLQIAQNRVNTRVACHPPYMIARERAVRPKPDQQQNNSDDGTFRS